MKIVVVGFKVAEANSVYYKKRTITKATPEEEKLSKYTVSNFVAEVGEMMEAAQKKGAEFVSVRFIKEAGE